MSFFFGLGVGSLISIFTPFIGSPGGSSGCQEVIAEPIDSVGKYGIANAH